MDNYLERVDDAIDGVIDKLMSKKEENNFNVVFIGYFGSALSHALDHNCYYHLSKDGLEKIQGINNEAARRYRENKKHNKQNDPNGNNQNIDDKLNNMNKNNKNRYKDKKARDEAIDKIIKNDYNNKNSKEINNNGNNNENFWDILKNGIDGIFSYFGNLFFNSWWLLKENFMNYWSNKFGKGNYGFHICPYGCGRPIPNAFYGCSELLSAFPNYFNQ